MSFVVNPYRFGGGAPPADFGLASRSFDGTDDYIEMGDVDGSIWQGAGGKMSVAMWVKGIPTGSGLLIGKYGALPAASQEWLFLARNDGDVEYVAYGASDGSSNVRERTDAAALTSEWVHVGATFDETEADADKIKVAVNGSFVATTNSLTGSNIVIQNSTEDLCIGARDEGTGLQYNGKIADARIYGTILTESQFGDLANGVNVGTPWGHWLLDTDDVTDYGTAGNDGHSTADSTFDTDGPLDP